jgi:hypothetical protein
MEEVIGGVTPRPARVRLWPRRPAFAQGDRAWLACFVLLPLLVFALPALVGHPVLLGDDLTQNEPLRVLVGLDLREGHLPLLDPYLWSGAPLLAGWNAGAAYPLTWLFALLPATAAWTAGLVATWWVATISFYALLRALGLVPSAAGVGAVSFAFGGAFVAQVVHFGLVAGMSWVPLQVLAVHRLTRGDRPQAPGRWVALLAGATGLSVLAGEPRAIDDALVVVVCFGAWRTARLGRASLVPALAVFAGLALGVGIGALQWLPGLEAVRGSQRASASAALFAAGALPDRWLALLLVPNLLGGSGSLRQPAFLPAYNLTEVSGYLGALPVVVSFGLLGTLRRGRRLPEWLIWHLVALVGVVLALGVNTPLGHLLVHVPFYGAQRLQSRNVVVLDFALGVLAGYGVDALVASRSWRAHGGARTWTSLLVAVASALLVAPVVALGIGGNGFLKAMKVATPAPGEAAALMPEVLPFALLGVVAGALVAWPRPVAPRRLVALSCGLAWLNLLVFASLVVVAIPPFSPAGQASASKGGSSLLASADPGSLGRAGVATHATARPIGALGLGGRFAIYDPDLLEASQLAALKAPDENVVSATPSVLGYGSIVPARYAAATGSHGTSGEGQNVFSPTAAANGVFDELDTKVLLTLPAYLLRSPSTSGIAPASKAGTRRVEAKGTATWYFGGPFALSCVAIRLFGSAGTATIRLGIVTERATTHWLKARRVRVPGLARWSWRAELGAAGVVAASSRSLRMGAARLCTSKGVLVANGELAAAISSPRWRYVGQDGAFGVFEDLWADPPLQVRPLPGQQGGRASIEPLGGPASAPSVAAVDSSRGALVVRSVSAIPGWQAIWHPEGRGRPRRLAIRRQGLVQAVAVPPGRGVLVFRYEAPGFVSGALVTLVSLAVLLALIVASPSRRARRARADASRAQAR